MTPTPSIKKSLQEGLFVVMTPIRWDKDPRGCHKLMYIKKLKQKDIIIAFAQGKTHQQVRDTFKISHNCLKLHLRRIRKLGLEPTDLNACRKHIMGPTAKHFFVEVKISPISPKQLTILHAINAGKTMEEVWQMLRIGWQSCYNLTCDAFRRIGIPRRGKPRNVWRAELATYLRGKQITMDDPFFN